MKKTLLSLLFLTCILCAIGQDNPSPYINVTGTAEMEVIPDEIYIAITIREDNDGRTKRSVEEQENDLKNALVELGIRLDNLELSDANADYIYIKWRKKEAISRTNYRLKVSTAEEVVGVFEKLDDLKIKSGRIVKVSHSKIKEYKKDVRVEAIKNAKKKADYLLAAIGERTGKALEVYENNILNTQRLTSNSNIGYEDDLEELIISGLRGSLGQGDKFKSNIQFQKIKLKSSMFVKFGIE